jgi:uncharacterized MAPEG superfamily protein
MTSMTTELILLGWTLVLALFQIMLTAGFRSRETGLHYNMGARDTPAPPMGRITARLQRAQANLFETLPLFAAAVLATHMSGQTGELTLWGSMLYLGARVLYVPLYAAGVPLVRSLAWVASIVGLVMVLAALLA